MKIIYSPEQKREALALARREGIPAASRHYGVAKNTIYRWKAAIDLNGLLEEEAGQENKTSEMEAPAEGTEAIPPTSASSKSESAESVIAPVQDTDSTEESIEQPQSAHPEMDVRSVAHRSASSDPKPPAKESIQMADTSYRNRRLSAVANADHSGIIAMILDENARLHRENQQLRRALQALVEL